MSEFEAPRPDLAAIRGGMDTRFSRIENWLAGRDGRVTGFDGHAAAFDLRFAHLGTEHHDRPDAGTIHQAALPVFAAMFATVAGTLAMLEATSLLP